MSWKGKKASFTMNAHKNDRASLPLRFAENAQCHCYAAYGLSYGPGTGRYREQYHLKLSEF